MRVSGEDSSVRLGEQHIHFRTKYICSNWTLIIIYPRKGGSGVWRISPSPSRDVACSRSFIYRFWGFFTEKTKHLDGSARLLLGDGSRAGSSVPV